MNPPDDKHDFLPGTMGYCNHRPLLLCALEATAGSREPVIELGMGLGSTAQLWRYCKAEGRTLISLDSDGAWCSQWKQDIEHATATVDFAAYEETLRAGRYSVALVDHAPGERRHKDVIALADLADIIVIHDSQPRGGYLLDRVWNLFPYRVDVKHPEAWASAVSRTVDVTAWRGWDVGGWLIE